MTLIVETGAIVTGSNTLVSRADYIAYALSLGITIADDVNADIELIKAMRFINSNESRLIGYRVSRVQTVSYPRTNLVIDGFAWLENEIPTKAKQCQMEFGLDINSGLDPYNKSINTKLARRKVRVEGAVEVEYMGMDSDTKMLQTTTAMILLDSLVSTTGLFVEVERR